MDSFPFSLESLSASAQHMLPLFLLLGTGLALMLLDAFGQQRLLPWLAAAGLAASGLLAWAGGVPESRISFFGMMETGGIAPLVHAFLCLSGVLTLFFLTDYLKRYERPISDIYALLVFSVVGMILMANAQDLIMTFIGLETMSMCLYIFAALFKTDPRSNEAGLKYFLLGSFASAFLLFGISLLYGLTGSTQFGSWSGESAQMLMREHAPLFYVAAGLLLIGFLFKVSAFPFHTWTPDVYAGTPTPLAGFMATGSKMASFVALAALLRELVPDGGGKLTSLLAIAALLTMIYGNLVAVQQTNLKRMLAYSSIAHSGYVLLGLCSSTQGFEAMLFYMFIYLLMNLGAFGIVGMAERDFPDTEIDAWRGLGRKSPLYAGALAVFLFSLAGIPPLAGFMGKYQVFAAALRADLLFLAIVGILTSVIGAYYYIRVIVLMFFDRTEPAAPLSLTSSRIPVIGAALLAFLVILLGIFPALILSPIRDAFQTLTVAGAF
ncbi:MAG: NADH-quinone oxidoreductase subunit N [Bacteroidia bacterium]|nr:NADH-quinone oxidoreductase subunit N [Bacteroidia bacterium]